MITTITLGPAELRHTVLVFDGSFAIGLRVPKCRTWYETDKEHGYWHTIGFDDAESGSCAIVNAAGLWVVSFGVVSIHGSG